MRRSYPILLLTTIFIVSYACGEDKSSIDITIANQYEQDTTQVQVPNPVLRGDSTFNILFKENPIEVIVKMPTEAFIGTIIVLPGWNFPNTGWCDSTELCTEALARGYVLILPQMGKSIYCDHIYPQTRSSWLSYPTRSWMKDEMIPFIQDNFALLLTEQPNFTLGLSTGARGATLLALDMPELFDGCAALSGDFDQSAFPKDNLYIGYYGQMSQFKDRWTVDDNIITAIDKLEVPMYVGHGTKDKVVDIQHSNLFVKAMEIAGKEYEYHIDDTAGHTYSYWNSEVGAMLDYFGSLDKKD
ncbi:MAG: S-formylglutathione hydrolase FrmB [Flavobacteriaceae bacterium]